MADFSDFNTAARAVSAPSTSPADLAAIVAAQPSLWVQVARHPRAYPDLLNYLGQYGGDDVRQAVWQRNAAAQQVAAPQVAASVYQPMVPSAPMTPQQASQPAVGRPARPSRGKPWVSLLIAVVAVALVLGALFGIPGTGWGGFLKPGSNGPSFANGYYPAWTNTPDDLGVKQDCAKLGLETATAVVMGQAQSSNVAIILARCQSGDKQASIWYGVDTETGKQIWSTVDTTPDLTSCASDVVGNKLYCTTSGSGDASSQPSVVSINTDTGEVTAPTPSAGTPGSPGPSQPGGPSQPPAQPPTSVPLCAVTVPSTVALGGSVYRTTVSADCSETVMRFDPSTGNVVWTVVLPATYPTGVTQCSSASIGGNGIVGVQGDVLLAGCVGTSAVDIATGKVLYTADGMGFTGKGKVFAVAWELVDHTPGDASFTDSTGATWQVTRADGYIDGQWAQFGGSPFSLPLQYHSNPQSPPLDLMADQSGTVWQSDPVPLNRQPISGFYDGNTLLAVTTGGAVYRLDPNTGKTMWSATVPVPSPQPSAQGTPNTGDTLPSQLVQPPQIIQLDQNLFLVTAWAADGSATTSLFDSSTGTVLWTMDGAVTATSNTDGGLMITTADGVTSIQPVLPGASSSASVYASGTPSPSATPTPMSVCGPDGQAGWVDGYINFIRSKDIPDWVTTSGTYTATFPGTRYELDYVNDDDVPELYVQQPDEADGELLATIDGNNVSVVQHSESGSWYLERQNLILTSGGHMDEYFDDVSSIVDGQFVTLDSGTYGAVNNANVQYDSNGDPIYEYYWDGVKVSKDAYGKAVAAAFDKSQAKQFMPDYIHSNMDANAMIQQLNSLRAQCTPTSQPSEAAPAVQSTVLIPDTESEYSDNYPEEAMVAVLVLTQGQTVVVMPCGTQSGINNLQTCDGRFDSTSINTPRSDEVWTGTRDGATAKVMGLDKFSWAIITYASDDPSAPAVKFTMGANCVAADGTQGRKGDFGMGCQ